MIQQYLLDTNIISDLIRNPQGQVFERIRSVGEGAISTSVIVACELRYGAQKKGSVQLTQRIEALLDRIEVLVLPANVDQKYGSIRADLERKGTLIGGNDLLIAAHAVSQNLTLVTANQSEFSRVTGLNVENWLVDQPGT
ncbi:MAG: type II toxin-antitoxin system VapC family toxin [Pseudomonadota bacterium]